MKRSGLIFQSIALIILVVAFILFWNSNIGTTFVEGNPTLDQIATDSYSDLQENLYRMLPVVFGSILFSVSIAFYLEEWVAETSWKYRIVASQIAILACIPSLLYGILGIYFFVFQTKKVSYFAHALTIVLLVMPIVIQSTQKAIKGVAMPVRDAAYALGANRWRVISDHVFPLALPSILAGIFTAISRALAIAALIIVVHIVKNHVPHSGGSFNIPSSVIVLLSSALLSSIISSFLQKKPN